MRRSYTILAFFSSAFFVGLLILSIYSHKTGTTWWTHTERPLYLYWSDDGTLYVEIYLRGTERGIGWDIPHWYLILAAGVIPLFWLRDHYRARLQKSRIGLCQKCGYDLRATPHRCPECGTLIPPDSSPHPAPL